MCEAGAIPRPNNPSAQTIDTGTLQKERESGFTLDRIHRFRYRTRYFTDSAIIGIKAFVADQYLHVKHYFQSKNDKKPKPIKGLNGLFSLKRPSERI